MAINIYKNLKAPFNLDTSLLVTCLTEVNAEVPKTIQRCLLYDAYNIT